MNGMLVIAALEFTVSLWALRRMFFAGGFHDISSARRQVGFFISSGLSWALLKTSAFECLTFSGVSLGAFLCLRGNALDRNQPPLLRSPNKRSFG